MSINWNVKEIIEDFYKVAEISGIKITDGALTMEFLPAPHEPTSLNADHMAIYIFSHKKNILKVGKVGLNSQARYKSQHYNARSALSSLAKSIEANYKYHGLSANDKCDVGKWMKTNLDRVNIQLHQSNGILTLNLLEAYLHCRLKPQYEGYKSQK